MSTPNDSLFALFLSQPLVLWSFVLGVLVLVTAVSINITATQRRKKTAARKKQLQKTTPAEATAPLPIALETAVAALANLDEPEAEKVNSPTAVNPLAAIANDAGEAATGDAPEFAGVEVNSKLADLFHNDIIIDPHVQALRDSLDDVPLADLLAQLHDVADQLKEHIPQPAFEVQK